MIHRKVALIAFACIVAAACQPAIADTSEITPAFGSYSDPVLSIHVALGDVRATLSRQSADDSDGYRSRLRISRHGALLFDRVLDDRPDGIALVPQSGRSPLVFVRTYSGGAHCCVTSYFIDSTDEFPAIRKVDFGNYPPVIRRIGPNGEYQFVTTNGTAYTFGSFSGGVGPPRILAFRNGDLADVTAEHLDMVRRDQHDMLKRYYTSNGVNGDAALVTYIADGYILKDSAAAWERVRSIYTGDFTTFTARANDWLRPNGYF